MIINGISTGAYVLNKNLVIAMMVVREREEKWVLVQSWEKRIEKFSSRF